MQRSQRISLFVFAFVALKWMAFSRALTGDEGGLNDTGNATISGSQAVCASAPVNNLDQRGVLRPQSSICDIGAVERRPSDSDLAPWLYLPLIRR